jgi:polygalacturonase
MKIVLIVCMLLMSAFVLGDSATAAEFAPEPDIFDVRSFGTVGDGVALDTKPIQDAIDACHKNNGGIVWVPAGDYHIGTIRMKSNVTLSLDHGASLLGSQNLADYKSLTKHNTEGYDTCLISAEDATDIRFQGLGIIDGRGTREAFPVYAGSGGGRQRLERPKLLILVNCDRVTFAGLTYRNPAFWCLHLVDCKNVHFDGVNIECRNNNQNNDGIDLGGCKNVLIENCTINSGDDAVCLKSTSLHPCENIVVRACDLSSNTAGLKLGTSSRGGFVDIRVTDCYLHDCPMGAVKIQSVDGGLLENVELSRLTMERVGGPFFIRLGNRGRQYNGSSTNSGQGPDVEPEGSPVGTLRNVKITDVTAEVCDTLHDRMGIMITGIPGHRIEDISFENVNIIFPGGGPIEAVGREVPEDIARYPEQFFFGLLPSWALYIRHVDGISFKNCYFYNGVLDHRPPVVLDDVLNYDPSGLKIDED